MAADRPPERRRWWRRLRRLWFRSESPPAASAPETGWTFAPLPVFVISFNRGSFLRQVCDSYRRQTWPVRIIIHDNGSDDPNTLAVLDEFESQGVEVARRERIKSADELNLVDKTVQAFCRRENYNGPYAVTDCDIDLGDASPDSLHLYMELLALYPRAECVGPMLRIADISRSYPLFQEAMKRHIKQFWRHEPRLAQTSRGQVAFLQTPIDTTFAIHRGGQPFRRLKDGLRVYCPYEARHLDWYIEPDQPRDTYRQVSSAKVSHWNNAAFMRQFATRKSKVLAYKVVGEQAGRPTIVLRTTADNPA